MTNEEKAREICETIKSEYDISIGQERQIYSATLAVMKWKDDEWAERFKKAFEGLWTASFNVDNLSNEFKTTIEFELVTRE